MSAPEEQARSAAKDDAVPPWVVKTADSLRGHIDEELLAVLLKNNCKKLRKPTFSVVHPVVSDVLEAVAVNDKLFSTQQRANKNLTKKSKIMYLVR